MRDYRESYIHYLKRYRPWSSEAIIVEDYNKNIEAEWALIRFSHGCRPRYSLDRLQGFLSRMMELIKVQQETNMSARQSEQQNIQYLKSASNSLQELVRDLGRATWEEFLHIRSGILGIVLHNPRFDGIRGEFENLMGDYFKRAKELREEYGKAYSKTNERDLTSFPISLDDRRIKLTQ